MRAVLLAWAMETSRAGRRASSPCSQPASAVLRVDGAEYQYVDARLFQRLPQGAGDRKRCDPRIDDEQHTPPARIGCNAANMTRGARALPDGRARREDAARLSHVLLQSAWLRRVC